MNKKVYYVLPVGPPDVTVAVQMLNKRFPTKVKFFFKKMMVFLKKSFDMVILPEFQSGGLEMALLFAPGRDMFNCPMGLYEKIYGKINTVIDNVLSLQ